MRKKLTRFASPVVALVLFAMLLLSPAMTSGQKKKSPSGGGGGASGNCAACANRAQRACEGSPDPRACFEQNYMDNCVNFYGCSMVTNPF